jgi:hypothetical protein
MFSVIASAAMALMTDAQFVSRVAERHVVLARCINEHAAMEARLDTFRQERKTAVGDEAAELDKRITAAQNRVRFLKLKIECIREQISIASQPTKR